MGAQCDDSITKLQMRAMDSRLTWARVHYAHWETLRSLFDDLPDVSAVTSLIQRRQRNREPGVIVQIGLHNNVY
ncbi:MAG: hypothetical protein R3F38_08055 [Gammaproteobacteria bacterium]